MAAVPIWAIVKPLSNYETILFFIMKTRLILIVLILAGAWCDSACMTMDLRREKEDSAAIMAKYAALYLESVCQREAGDTVAQYRLLERAIRLNPNGAEALYDMAELSMTHDVPVDQADLLQRAHSLDPRNEDYTMALAEYKMAVGDSTGAELMKTLTHSEAMRDEAYSRLCSYYVALGKYDSLCNVLESWRVVRGDDNFILSCKLQGAMQTGQLEAALLIADTLIQANPYDCEQYEVIKGEILLGLNRDTEALQAYAAVAAKDSLSPTAQVLLYKYAIKNSNKELENRALKLMIANPDMQIDTRVAALRSYMGPTGTSLHALKRDSLIQMLLSLPDDDPTLCQTMIALLHQEEADTLCLPLYNKLLEINPADEYVRINLMQNALAREDYKEVERLCTDGMKQNAREPLFYYFSGAAKAIEKKDEEALTLFRKGLSFVTPQTNTELVSSFYSSCADALHKLGRKREAYLMYDTALVYNNGNVMCLNNYAYFLSLDSAELDKAERMSAYTISINPEEPTYLDTYAWILYLRGKYEDARHNIDKAISYSDDENDPSDATLYDHAGDIYLRLGLTDKAIAFWQQAQRLDPSLSGVKAKIQRARRSIK